MTQKQAIQLFEDRKVRTVWDERTETWYFSVLDVISALTDTVNPTDYFKKMRKRDEALASFVGTNCPQIAMRSETGVMRKTLAGDVKTVLRIIQSIPSQKAEPFKQWMAQVASDRLDQMQDPELSIEQAVADYKRLGYSDTWINQRLKSIEVRKLLTDEWKRGGVDGTQYATLTDIITKEWAGHLRSTNHQDFARRPPRTTFRAYRGILPLVGNVGNFRSSIELFGNIVQPVFLCDMENALFQFVRVRQ